MLNQNRILQTMMRIRIVEEEIAKRYHQGRMRCPTHLSIGQEAVPSVLSQYLTINDLVVSSHRGHAHYLAKGGNLNKMIAEIYGKETGCSKGKGGSMHLIDLSVGFMGTSAIVGNSIPIGVGIGLALKLDRVKNISVIYMGDGASEEGVFYESLNFAVLKQLPTIFICENNHYSVYSPKSVRQPEERSIAQVAKSLGLKSDFIDGNDVNVLDKIIPEIVKYVRSGKGPYFLECDTYRYREHCGPNFDDELGYRPTVELENWKKKDPIEHYIRHLDLKNKIIRQIRDNIFDEVQKAFEFAEKSSFPHVKNAFEGEYAI